MKGIDPYGLAKTTRRRAGACYCHVAYVQDAEFNVREGLCGFCLSHNSNPHKAGR